MFIKDKIYGKFKIEEPVLVDLIKSVPIQRLKGISQYGYSEPFHPKTDFSRFEHSIGVFLLLRKYNASLEEQVAGLIHDVSHSAFSHCIDYISKTGSGKTQGHQDNIFNEFVKNSEIPKILKKYKISLDYILDDKNFPLKEKLLPDLCADRLDYTLRAIFNTKLISSQSLQGLLNNLLVFKNNWVFKDLKSAELYANLFKKLNSKYYAHIDAAVMHQSVGEYLSQAISKEYISYQDLYTTDKEVLNKIKKYHKNDAKLQYLFAKMNNKIAYKNSPNNYDYRVHVKSRIVDPLFFDGEKIKRLSNKINKWQKIIRDELKPKTYYIKYFTKKQP